MSARETLLQALAPVLDVIKDIDPSDAGAQAKLQSQLPCDGDLLSRVGQLVRAGIEEGWLCDKEAGGIRFSRLLKTTDESVSIDAVHMDKAGPGHSHPNGEMDLCFAVSGNPTFDGNAPGWTVYPPDSWHVPTVKDGVMDILYFLPGGAIKFGPKPE